MKNIKNTLCMLAISMGLVFSFESPAFASTPNVDFIDVSHYNNENGQTLAFYQTIKASGVHGIVVKVSEDMYYVDPAASVNIANAKQAGLIVSAYHYARFTSNTTAKVEAQWFDKKLQLVGFDKKKDGYVVVDVEADNLASSAAQLTEYTNTFISEMHQLGYSRVDLYSGSYFYNHMLIPNDLVVSNPWLASYPANPVKDQPTANFSNGKGAWQWASDYHFAGMATFGNFDVSEDYAGKYTAGGSPVITMKDFSLVDYLNSNHMDASYSHRAILAKMYGITNYQGTPSQNLALLIKLESGMKPAKMNTSNSKLTTTQKTAVYPPTYTVKKGDTLSIITKTFHTTLSQLVRLNKIKNPNLIWIGEKIKLPSTPQTIANSTNEYYTVVKGDTLSGISAKYNTTVAKIKGLNKLKNDTIYPQEKLRVR